MKTNITDLINRNKGEISLILQRLQIFDDPSPEVIEEAYKYHGKNILLPILEVFKNDSVFSNSNGDGLADPGSRSTDYTDYTGNSESSFWNFNWVDDAEKYLKMGLDIYGQFQGPKHKDQIVYQPKVKPPTQAGMGINTNILLIAGGLIVAILLIVYVTKKL